jgi:hypothetical protein
MFGGLASDGSTRSDMYYWTGSNWTAIGYTNPTKAPSLWNHSTAWNGSAMIVTGGFSDSAHSPNLSTWRVTFDTTGKDGAWEVTWAEDANTECQNNAQSPTDLDIHPRAAMAYDAAAGWKVFFGGLSGKVTEANTVECR